ncbi:MAG: hypothetical protein AB8B83_06415 [Bdellovibrionales bacterium]
MSDKKPVKMQVKANIEKNMNAVAQTMMSLRKSQAWPAEMLMDQAITQSVHFLDEHLENLTNTADILLETKDFSQKSAEDIETLFRAWHINKNPPSLLALCVFALDHLNVSVKPDDMSIVIASAILGQVYNEPSYHNDMHFRKVLAQTIRLIANNNDIFKSTARELNAKDICTLLSAACIHDLDHNGQGNFIKGVHVEGHAEKHSFNIAKPYLQKAGCDNDTLMNIYIMLLTTDVSPMDDPTNPMMQMKAAYKFHYLGGRDKTHTLNLSTDISKLEKDQKLTSLCILLHEADIATSAAVTYDVTKFETSLIMEEFKKDKAFPKDVVSFLDDICQRRFLSDAGMRLFSANMARIYALAEEDASNGNEAYPASKYANFALPKSIANEGKTIN